MPARAVQNVGGHERPVLGESVRKIADVASGCDARLASHGRTLRACCPNHFGGGGARLPARDTDFVACSRKRSLSESQPQHVRQSRLLRVGHPRSVPFGQHTLDTATMRHHGKRSADLRIGVNGRFPANLAESEFGAPSQCQAARTTCSCHFFLRHQPVGVQLGFPGNSVYGMV